VSHWRALWDGIRGTGAERGAAPRERREIEARSALRVADADYGDAGTLRARGAQRRWLCESDALNVVLTGCQGCSQVVAARASVGLRG
jgi:hypothetical protein